ncbi:phage transcriptional activator, RinA family [Gracilibacillus orientalis]|uniref:Phage transcriptional activator, RinA family n=1 Tax=Gracilibacillus orientalis TaxID=334253 RepID=A0A1I4HBR1_9BACI|nr:transcriptional regulator [Gracilibacillus orientalis]SFL39200.1 phage transcriptional activator, RinA family [Gracilibacillus orientalis]
MQELQITKSTFKKVEAEWFNYHKTLKEIKLLEDSILHPFEEDPDDPTIVKGTNSVRMPGNPTERTATRLTTHKQLSYLREVTSAIETVYNESPDNYKDLIRLRYWKRNNKLTWIGIAFQLNISERQARRWRNEIVQATIEILGWR